MLLLKVTVLLFKLSTLRGAYQSLVICALFIDYEFIPYLSSLHSTPFHTLSLINFQNFIDFLFLLLYYFVNY